ncbi:MAG: hypothetical protein EOO68_29690 [Moraxellaceae bacterium]|nr:MAG: hypothetical protein EOO68_29690 [Moraxellaceae bacterium]
MHRLNQAAVRSSSTILGKIAATTAAKSTAANAGKVVSGRVVSGRFVPRAGLVLGGLLGYTLLLGGLLGTSSVWADSRWTNFSSRVTPQREPPQRRIIGQSGAYHYGDSRDDARDSVHDRDWSDRNRNTSRTARDRNSRNHQTGRSDSNDSNNRVRLLLAIRWEMFIIIRTLI